MKSSRAKVLHEVAGRPLIVWAVENARAAGASRVVAILGHQLDEVRRVLDERFGTGSVDVALQAEQKGTGHAVMCALPTSVTAPEVGVGVIVSGDAPLLLPQRVSDLARACEDSTAGMALVGTVADRPVAYGHLVRDEDDRLLRIVEHADATAEEKGIEEVNAGFYAISLGHLRKDTRGLSSDNAQGELYLTDLAAEAHGRGGAAVIRAPFEEISGINNRCDLAAVERTAQHRLREALLLGGVTMVSPDSVHVDADIQGVGEDSWIGPGVSLRGRCLVGEGVRIDQGCVLQDATLGDRVELAPYTIVEKATLGESVKVGPFTRVGPECRVDSGASVGSCCDIVSSHILSEADIRQQCYVGHSTVGAGATLGAGTITCDFDGNVQNRTTIESGAFVGSGTQLVAPVTVGRDAYVGAGTTATRDVSRGSLGLSRTKQVNVEGWGLRFREAQAKRSGAKKSDG